MELSFLQTYWWILISILGAILVFMLFVQGGQSLIRCGVNDDQRNLIVNTLGSKWELTFTTLVVFGGAFFAAFPLFYSTSFGGAYWLWMLILFSFVVQAVSYEFRSKRGNLLGAGTYDACMIINGIVGPVLLGVAVGIMFFGGQFTVEKLNIVSPSNPVISTWAPTHGLEAITNWRCLLLGVTVFFLARTLGALYIINNTTDAPLRLMMRIKVKISGLIFALLFVAFVVVLLTFTGLRQEAPGVFVAEKALYFNNLLAMWWLIPLLLIAVLAVLYGIFRTAFCPDFNKGIWWAGVGTIVVVLVLFFLAGFNNTPYYPSLTDPASSLTVANSSSTPYTLRVMAWVSLVIPIVIAYIAYTWRRLNRLPASGH